MISEVLNALLLTYVATEYLLASSSSRGGDTVVAISQRLMKSNTNRIAVLVVVVVNLMEHYHFNYRASAHGVMDRFLHVPRIVVAAVAYIVVLYFDCKRVSRSSLSLKSFLARVGMAFLRVAPAYPFLAVLISFGFLFVITAFEALHLNLDLLNMPIYYGTVYGPFSFVYWSVKSRVVDDFLHSLPTNKRTDETTT